MSEKPSLAMIESAPTTKPPVALPTANRQRRPTWASQLLYLIAIWPLLASRTTFGAEVFRWEDPDGQVHYSDHTAPGASKLTIRSQDSPIAQTGFLTVIRVYDGDTITLENGEKVRLLGINTPEVQGRRSEGEAGGQEARKWLADRIQGRKVRLETDATQRDKYNRLLAHVFTEDGTHVNLQLVEKGLATTDIYPPNLKYIDELLRAERQAERSRLGLWTMPDYRPKPLDWLGTHRPEGWLRLKGSPASLDENRKYQKLIFDAQFEVHVPKENLALFPSLKSYLGKTVEARGWAFCRGAICSMVIRHPSALVSTDP